MLKQRIPTAIILVAIVLAALFLNNPLFWRGLISIAVLVGFWEWLRFCKITTFIFKAVSYGLFIACFYFLQMGYIPIEIIVYSACLLWVTLLLFTMTSYLDVLHDSVIKMLIGVVVLSTSGWIIISFKSVNPLWVLCFMVSVWAADVGAYFVGKRFGKTKLAPRVSPGKTVEGMLGGVGLMLLVYVPVLFYLFSIKAALLLLLTLVITTLVSVGGDLFESKMKRYSGLKDSSQILPGHGGVLDRIDSLLSGAPFFALGLIMLGYIN